MSYTKIFAQNPQAFAARYTLIPYCQMDVNQAHIKQLALSDGTHLKQVQGDNKVAFLDIVPASSFSHVPADLGGSYHDVGNLLVMHITTHRQNANALPVYYLPWAGDQMFRMKLKPSPNHAKRTDTWFFGLLGGDVITPNIFVTAAVQGCSVFVEGDPASPVVYHVNAGGTNPTGGATNTSDNRMFVQTVQFKADYMTSRMQMASQRYPKTTSTHAPDSAHLMDYMPGMAPNNLTWLTDKYKRKLNSDDVTVLQFGTIFGLREQNTWVFYRQTRTLLDYKVGDHWKTEFRDPVCLRFWP
jgi:hypothetical protein